MSAPVIFCSSSEPIISYNSLEVIPTASGFPTPGANAGSKTSKSILTYNLSNTDTASLTSFGALPCLISQSEIVLILYSSLNANSSLT